MVKERDIVELGKFEPTYEDEKIRVWDSKKLAVKLKDSDKVYPGVLDIQKDEKMHEVRIYYMRNLLIPDPVDIDIVIKWIEKQQKEKHENLINKVITMLHPNPFVPYVEGEFLKIISKINETKRVTYLLKSAKIAFNPIEGSIEEYNAFVQKVENDIGMLIFYDIKAVAVTDGKYFNDVMKEQVKK